VITGAQIRLARHLLGWDRQKLSKHSKVASSTVARAEGVDHDGAITIAQSAAVQGALERAGIEFVDGETPNVRLTERV
jgi:ribosome-binding protein aMBF1 (putative translation factor)